MMGRKVAEPKLYVNFSLDAAVPPNHLVRRLAQAVDFSFVHGLVQRYYSQVGKPSVDPVVLFKLLVLGYLYNIPSERRLCEEASLNLAWRWFLGYELDEPIPDHSVLTKARRRFGTKVFEDFFGHIVKLCEERGLIQGDVLFIDSTLSEANASQDTLRSRALTGQLLPKPAQFVRDLHAVNDPQPEPEAPRQKGPRGPKPGRAARPSVRDTLASTTDPDAELATRRDGRTRLAYKTQVVVDGGRSNVITAIQVMPAGDSDASATGRMLDKHQQAVGRGPRELVGDSGYGTDGGIRQCLARDVLPTLKSSSRIRSKDRFNAKDFAYVAERDVLICPAGEELHPARERFVDGKTIYQPAQRGVCATCPLRARCVPERRDRTVWRNWDAGILDAARAHHSTRRGRQRFRRRQVVSERTMADLKGKHGFERAQFRGRASVQIQASMTAAALNLKQLVKRHPEGQTGWAHGPFLTFGELVREVWIRLVTFQRANAHRRVCPLA
jgi:transposase